MGADDNKQTLQRFDRLVEACEAEQLHEICTPDMRNHALASQRNAGLEGTEEFLRECREDQGKAAWLRGPARPARNVHLDVRSPFGQQGSSRRRA